MAKADHYLWQRGRQYYFRLAIPRSMRHLFLTSSGKAMDKLAEPLGDSFKAAKEEAEARVVECRALFRQIEAGTITTPEQVKEAMQRGPAEPDVALQPGFDAAMRRYLASPAMRRAEFERRGRAMWERRGRRFDEHGDYLLRMTGEQAAPTAAGETINQAAEAWLKELARDEARRDTTLKGHRDRVRAFVDKVGDVPLTAVTRATARDFLDGLNVKVRTRNNYADTLKGVFKSAGRRGRFSNAEADNPFEDQRSKVVKNSYVPFTAAELQTLFDAMPRDVKPKKHTPDTALPWVALIALYTGARLEEIAQLTTADVRAEGANGATVTVIDIHNGGENKLKNESSARLIPVHSALVHADLLKYVEALPSGPLFPGLKRRESKGNKVGARIGELFRRRLVALGLKRAGLCFHSFRHTVAGALDAAGVPQSDAARILGHAVAGMSYGTYSQAGPGLIRVKDVVEKIKYEGLRI
jgi:integrase